MRTLRLTREHLDALVEFAHEHDADEIHIRRGELIPGLWETDQQSLEPVTVEIYREDDAYFAAIAEITHCGCCSESVTRA
jgi:hypothetical protein